MLSFLKQFKENYENLFNAKDSQFNYLAGFIGILEIAVIIFIITGITTGTYLYFKKPMSAVPTSEIIKQPIARQIPLSGEQQPQGGITSKCGDGICESVEKTNPNACPQDCGKNQTDLSPTPATQMPPISGNAKTIPVDIINFHQLAIGKNFGNILKLFNPAIDEKNRRLYVVGSKTTSIGVVDLNTDTLIETWDMGVPGGFLIFNNNNLYSYTLGVGGIEACHQVDLAGKTASTMVSAQTCTNILPAPNTAKSFGNYSFIMKGYSNKNSNGRPGFPTDWRQDLNASYGIIEIYNSSNKKVGEILSGLDSLYFVIDQTTGKLYTTATGDSVVSVFDLNNLESANFCQNNNCWVKDIDVGDMIDQVIVDSKDNMYARNRLGGNVIYKYNLTSKSFTIIDNENHLSGGKAMFSNEHSYDGIAMWPTGMELSKDEKTLYVLSHYGALIDVIDTSTNKVRDRIKFITKLKPRTDGISIMAMDKEREKIFAAFPELGIIGVANGINKTVVGYIDLTKYGFDSFMAANGGPGEINMAVDENTGNLYVYFPKKILVFNGKTFEKETEAATTVDIKKESILTINGAKSELYLKNKIFDLTILKEKGVFSKGEKVSAFDNQNSAVYLDEPLSINNKGFQKQLKVYKLVSNSVTQEWTIDNLGEIIRTFFDFTKNVFYTVDSLSARVIKQDLASGLTPSLKDEVSNDCDLNKDGKIGPIEEQMCGKTGMQQPSVEGQQIPVVGTTDKCGDGVCGPVEKANNVCPQDCKNQ